MPRPPERVTYTHSQFEVIASDNQGETVRCLHCKEWTGGAKTLNRKKEHLLKCPAYLAWRAAGNGEDLQPANSYHKRPRDSSGIDDDYDNPSYAPQHTPQGPRNKYPEMGKFFDEFWDDTTGQKCMRARCLFCGYVRAKNTTRQFEHLQTCQDFLRSTEGQQAQAKGELDPVRTSTSGTQSNGTSNRTSGGEPDIWRGSAPNPNLMMPRPNTKTPGKVGRPPGKTNATPSRPQAVAKLPSMINHLLSKNATRVSTATQQPFLSHAGCGTLSASALNQWLAQEIHISRALIPFVGSLIGKIRVPETDKLQYDPTFRATDLLCSAVNNMKKELEFIEATKRKYLLHVAAEEPKPATKGIIDLFQCASSAQASLLEGLVVLWSIEHLFCVSFQYAGNFISTMGPPANSYSLPSYHTPHAPGGAYGAPAFAPPNPDNSHISALHESFIQNWTSANYIRFVEACKAIVDEIANAQTSGNGAQEMMACERTFKQALWLWDQIWPEVTGMGEEDEFAAEHEKLSPAAAKTGAVVGGASSSTNGNGTDRAIEINDEEDADGEVNSPFGGTGLGAVDAANRAAGI